MGKYKIIFAAVAIFIAAAACYVNTINNPFVYDDLVYITGNKSIENPSNLKHLFTKKYFAVSGERSYRPVSTLMSFMEHSMGNGDPRAYRISSILIHSTTAVLAFLFIISVTGNPAVSFFAGLIYAVHPLQSEAVNASSFVEDPLSAMFMFAALFAYARFRKNFSILKVVLTGLLSLLAMLSKESAAVLPLIMFACEGTIGAASPQDRKKGNALILSSFAALAIFLILRFGIFTHPSPAAAGRWPGGSPSSAYFITSLSFLKYLKLFFMPSGFSIEQCINAAGNAAFTKVVFSNLLHLSFLAIAIVFRKRNRILSFASVFYLVSLLPVSNIIPFGAYIAERYMYIPSFGLSLFLVCTFIYQEDSSTAESSRANTLSRIAFCMFLICVAVLLAFTTIERNRDWKSPLVLWQKAAETCPNSSKARSNYGRRLIEEGDYEKAIYQLYKAVKIDPAHYEAWSSLGVACMNYGDMKCAGNALIKAFSHSPTDDVKYNMALYFLKTARFKKAISLLTDMLSINPKWIDGRYMLGNAYLKTSDYEKAEEQFIEVLSENPDYISALGNLGVLYIETGRLDEAARMFEKVLKLEPSNATARKNMERISAEH